MSIFDLHTSKARYDLKVVLLYLGAKMTKLVPRFIRTLSEISSQIKLRHNYELLL
jgi:hypothetical protein